MVVLGQVDDQGSLFSGWNYPFTRAVEDWVGKLEQRGYRRVRVVREPEVKHLRRLLAGPDFRAVVFVGHGHFERRQFSFQLNGSRNLSGEELREWAMEDLVRSTQLSETAKARLEENALAEDALRRASSYNFDLAIVHSCNSMRCPELRGALGGAFRGQLDPFLHHVAPAFHPYQPHPARQFRGIFARSRERPAGGVGASAPTVGGQPCHAGPARLQLPPAQHVGSGHRAATSGRIHRQKPQS